MATPTIVAHKLGKLPVRTDVRTLALARYVDRTKLPDPPATFDESTTVHDWPMYRNDRIGDCTVAAAAHMIEAWTGTHGAPVELPEQIVLDAFDRVKIADPFSGEEGAVVLDVLKLWRDPGIGDHRIGAFARLSVHDHRLAQAAAWLFGGLYLGVQLPETAKLQETWDWTGQLNGPARPGSWGGHAVDVVRYDERALTVVTWGALKQLTWEFWDRYVDEAYCILSQDFLDGDRAPNGFDLEALKADLALITA